MAATPTDPAHPQIAVSPNAPEISVDIERGLRARTAAWREVRRTGHRYD